MHTIWDTSKEEMELIGVFVTNRETTNHYTIIQNKKADVDQSHCQWVAGRRRSSWDNQCKETIIL